MTDRLYNLLTSAPPASIRAREPLIDRRTVRATLTWIAIVVACLVAALWWRPAGLTSHRNSAWRRCKHIGEPPSWQNKH